VNLPTLYSEFIEAAIAALRHRGHLIICLPGESYTGRALPYCTGNGLITNQVLIKAKASNKRIYVPARSLPSKLLVPPLLLGGGTCPTAHDPSFPCGKRLNRDLD
jgi:hypothetical protein